jgi:hypothetical protein
VENVSQFILELKSINPIAEKQNAGICFYTRPPVLNSSDLQQWISTELLSGVSQCLEYKIDSVKLNVQIRILKMKKF